MPSCKDGQNQLRAEPKSTQETYQNKGPAEFDNLRLNGAAASVHAKSMIRTLFSSCIGLSIGIATICPEALGQTPAAAANTDPVDEANLRQQFSAGFSKGCLGGQTPGISNQVGFCACMATAYTTRYNGRTLSAISQLAARAGAAGPPLVDVMMAPERQACIRQNSAAPR